MLIGRVGLHVFHHHEEETGGNANVLSGISLHAGQDKEAADCALCELDTFQELAIEALTVFVFFVTVVKPVHRFLLTELPQLSFFAKSRGPPSPVAVTA